jgi:hypothetical protein
MKKKLRPGGIVGKGRQDEGGEFFVPRNRGGEAERPTPESAESFEARRLAAKPVTEAVVSDIMEFLRPAIESARRRLIILHNPVSEN